MLSTGDDEMRQVSTESSVHRALKAAPTRSDLIEDQRSENFPERWRSCVEIVTVGWDPVER